jgi:hypothetical protein
MRGDSTLSLRNAGPDTRNSRHGLGGGRVKVDEVEERAEAAVRLNNLIRCTGQQAQQLIREYSCSPGATVGGLASLGQQAVTTLEELCYLKERLLGRV